MKFLFEIGDVLSIEKNIARNFVEDVHEDILGLSHSFIKENQLILPREFIPIGTVEFVCTHLKNLGKSRPEPLDYPDCLYDYLGRTVRFDYAVCSKDTDYIKPLKTKEFTCSPKHELKDILIGNQKYWISDPIDITQEYRMYVMNNALIGYSRYDTLEEDDVLPNIRVVNDMIRAYRHEAPRAYTLDVALLRKGGTVLIEVNDMFATGYYKFGTMSEVMYIEALRNRWEELTKNSK